MNILIILGIVILLYFLYKVHTSAAKFDDSLHMLNTDENEYFIESEINRTLQCTAYFDTYGSLPNNTKSVFVSIKAKQLIYNGAVDKICENIQDIARTDMVEMTENDKINIKLKVGNAVRRTMAQMYKH